MRYVSVPVCQDPTLANLVREICSLDPRFRDEWSGEWDAVCEAADLLEAQGTVVGLTDEAHERIAAALKAAQIRPDKMRVVMPLIHAITKAPAKKPDGVRGSEAVAVPAS